MEAKTRTATMDDYPSIRRLLRELDDHHVALRPDVFQPYDDPTAERDRVARFVERDDAELFVAEHSLGGEGAIVGLASVRISENPSGVMFRPGRRALMDDLVVTRDHRGTGIAQELLKSVAQWAASCGVACLVINVWNANESGVAFFAKSGFVGRCLQMELRVGERT